jgi:hypothetical protein
VLCIVTCVCPILSRRRHYSSFKNNHSVESKSNAFMCNKSDGILLILQRCGDSSRHTRTGVTRSHTRYVRRASDCQKTTHRTRACVGGRAQSCRQFLAMGLRFMCHKRSSTLARDLSGDFLHTNINTSWFRSIAVWGKNVDCRGGFCNQRTCVKFWLGLKAKSHLFDKL